MVTIGQVLEQKKANFIKFLKTTNLSKHIEFKNYINTLQTLNIDQFIYFIRQELFKYRGRESIFVDSKISEYGLILNEHFKLEEYEKFVRYIELFIEVCS